MQSSTVRGNKRRTRALTPRSALSKSSRRKLSSVSKERFRLKNGLGTRKIPMLDSKSLGELLVGCTSPTNTLGFLARESLQSTNQSFIHQTAFHPFSLNNIRMKGEADVPSHVSHLLNSEFEEEHRCSVLEIISTGSLVFSLLNSGMCVAYNCTEEGILRPLCLINQGASEIIRSIFLNKKNKSLITVSVTTDDGCTSLRCRSTKLVDIMVCQVYKFVPIFASESLKYPGFVEFDDVNGKVLTYSAESKLYRVWDLEEYTPLYSLNNVDGIEEVKISCGVMLQISKKSKIESHIHLPLKIIDIETGEVMKEIKQLLKKHRKLDFIEQFNEKLLIKQESEPLQIIDVCTGDRVEISHNEFATPSAFIFLYQNQMFLTFHDRTIVAWNFQGEVVARFQDHKLMHSDCNTSTIYITQAQDFILSYCCDTDRVSGCISISNIFTGRNVGKLSSLCSVGNMEAEALNDVSAIYYNEDRQTVYTGNKNGQIHCWST